MGDNLYGLAQVLPPALLVQHVPVNLSGGEVGELIQILVDETFIVPQIEVGFRAVLRDIDLPVLIGAHSAGVYIDIRIQFLRRNLESAGFQKAAQ